MAWKELYQNTQKLSTFLKFFTHSSNGIKKYLYKYLLIIHPSMHPSSSYPALFLLFFFFWVGSTPIKRLELITLRSRVICSADWTRSQRGASYPALFLNNDLVTKKVHLISLDKKNQKGDFDDSYLFPLSFTPYLLTECFNNKLLLDARV